MAHLRTAPALRRIRRIARQRGLTLIELMVALIVGLLVILAAMSVFTTTTRSAGTVDAAGQLRDDARFAADIIQRLAVQTGFEDIGFVTRTYQGTPQTYKAANGKVDPTEMLAPISGLSGQKPKTSSSGLIEGESHASTVTIPSGAADTLVLRYQAVNRASSETDADGSMLVCSGYSLGKGDAHSSTYRNHRAVSVFYVDQLSGDSEPTLYCRYANREGASLSDPIPLVKGVESFKVLYGVDNIAKNEPADKSDATTHAKLIPTHYLTANDIVVDGDEAATQTNWRRVRTLRVGLVLRAGDRPIQSGQAKENQIMRVLGRFYGYDYAVEDARLRQNYIFTVNVRNCLNQGYQPAGDPGKSASDEVPPCDVVVPREPSGGGSGPTPGTDA